MGIKDCENGTVRGELGILGLGRGGAFGAVVSIVILGMQPVIQWIEFGRSAGERLATEMALPYGLMWATAFVLTGVAIGQRFLARKARGREVVGGEVIAGETPGIGRYWRGITLFWLAMTLAGNPHIARQAVSYTEYPFVSQDRGTDFDAVVVLGGGIGAGPSDEAQFNSDADRIRPAIQLWNAGKAKQIIVTGTATFPGRPGPAELTEKLLVSFGIPKAAIVSVEGVNTTAEMKQLKKLYEQWPNGEAAIGRQPVWGLATSAFHMPRALRLAEAQQLAFVPLPTAFRSANDPIGVAQSFVPTLGNVDELSRCWKEWMAAILKR